MNAQEKAEELVEMFQTIVIEPFPNEMFCMDVKEAKQCALIAVYEILKGDHLIRTPLSYWQQVKEEIEKL